MSYTAIRVNSSTATVGDPVGFEYPTVLGFLEKDKIYTLQFKIRNLNNTTLLDEIRVGSQKLDNITISNFEQCVLDEDVTGYLCYITFTSEVNVRNPKIRIARKMLGTDTSNTDIFEVTDISLAYGRLSAYDANIGDFKHLKESINTRIQQLANSIVLSAAKEDIDYLSGKISEALGQIQVAAGKISLMVKEGDLSSLIEQLSDSVKIAFNGISAEWEFTNDRLLNKQGGKPTLSLCHGRLNTYSFSTGKATGYLGSAVTVGNEANYDGIAIAGGYNCYYINVGLDPNYKNDGDNTGNGYSPLQTWVLYATEDLAKGTHFNDNCYFNANCYANFYNHITVPKIKCATDSLILYTQSSGKGGGGVELFNSNGYSYFRPQWNNGAYLGSSSHRFPCAYFIDSPNISSDARMKKDISYLYKDSNALFTPNEVYDFFKNTYNPTTYKFSSGNIEGTKVGFIAQDLIYDKVGSYLVNVNGDMPNSNDPNDLPQLSYNQGNLEGLLAIAFKEEILKRDKEINLLEERIEKLENLIQKVGV